MPNHVAGAAGAAAMGLGAMFFMVSIGIGLFVTWIVSLMDVLKSEYEGDNTKTIWILLLLLMAPLGTILYQIIGKKQKLNNTVFMAAGPKKAPTKTKSEPVINTAKPTMSPIKKETCSKCGSIMTERAVLSGEKAGQKFLVCTKYPTCKFVLPLASA